jgi:hypothetical protein
MQVIKARDINKYFPSTINNKNYDMLIIENLYYSKITFLRNFLMSIGLMEKERHYTDELLYPQFITALDLHPTKHKEREIIYLDYSIKQIDMEDD